MPRIKIHRPESRLVPVGVLDWKRKDTFPGYLRALRRQAGVSLRAAASEMGISYSYLAKMETGEKDTPPSLKVLGHIADFYGRELAEVMREAGFDVQPAQPVPRAKAPVPLRVIEERFERLITHPDLTPVRWTAGELDLIPPLVKRQWIDFARKLARAVREDELDVAEVLAGEDAGDGE